MLDHLLVLGLIAVVLALLASERLPADLVSIGVLLVVSLAGWVEVHEALSGFSSPAVLTVIAMFILSGGLIRSGVTDYLASVILRLGGTSPARLTAVLMVTVGLLSAFMNNIGAVALLVPTVFSISRRAHYPPAKLLMPLAFAALLGGLTTLVGTPPNLLVSAALEDAGLPRFGLFELAPLGLALLAAGVVYMVLLGRHLIPERESPDRPDQRFQLEGYIAELVLPEGSPLAGTTLAASGLREKLGLDVLTVIRQSEAGPIQVKPTAQTRLEVGDQVLVMGDVSELVRQRGTTPVALVVDTELSAADIGSPEARLAEVVVAPFGSLIGRSVAEVDVRRRFDVLVLALKRRGHTLRERLSRTPLEPGDVLLVQGTPEALAELGRSAEFLVVSPVDHQPRDHSKAPLATGITALTLLLAASGLVHIALAGLLGALLMAVTGCIRPGEVYDSVEWRVVFLIAGMMPLGIAMDEHHLGTAAWLAHGMLDLVGGAGPLAVLAALLLFASLATEIVSNAAAAVLLAPIALALAAAQGLAPQPYLVAVAVGASTSLLTPVGHQVNTLIYGLGGYRFSDFARVGAPLNLIAFVVAMWLIPRLWPFTPGGP